MPWICFPDTRRNSPFLLYAGMAKLSSTLRLFDAHCHLQDPRIFDKAPQLISAAVDSGVVRFAVNGISEVH